MSLRAPALSAPTAAPAVFTVATWNVHKCRGRGWAYRPDRVAAVLAEIGADVVALQEADRRFGRRTGLLDADAIRASAGLQLLDVSAVDGGQGWHGNALAVRPGTEVAALARLDLPGLEPRGAVAAELVLPGGARVRVVAAHLGLWIGCRRRQGAVLAGAVRGGPVPTILMGDLNEWWPRHGALAALGAERVGLATFPARVPVLALDHIVSWPAALVSGRRVHDTAAARASSDHLPLVAEVDMDRKTPLDPMGTARSVLAEKTA